jgi:hypothetical protein
MWSATAPANYVSLVTALRERVENSTVNGVFLAKDAIWGTSRTGTWTHLSAESPSRFQSALKSPGQAMAVKREHFGTLSRGIAEFDARTVGQATTLLEADALYRTEKVIGPARFLHALHASLAPPIGREKRRNIMWRAVALAPAGFCTPRSGMIGTLLEDLAAGLPLDTVRQRFASKMHPLRYLRPQVAASAGNIRQAEATVEKLGIERSLHRRFARLEEVPTIWRPAKQEEPAAAGGGVFSHLRARDQQPERVLDMSPVPITWEKFERTVLATALAIHVYTTPLMNLGAFVTATHADAPPILQWDSEIERNPLSWYIYTHGSSPTRWELPLNSWIEATAIAFYPGFGHGDHHAKRAMIILAGAVDRQVSELCLFPETLKAELHPVRRTIEQFSKSRKIEGAEEATACGMVVPSERGSTIRVRSATGMMFYRIDRLD